MLQRSTLEAKMGSASFWIANNFLLGVLIYLSALLGAHFGIQGTTLKISVVWPATGFALAEVLLFGYGVSPGVFLGNFFYNYFHLVTSEHGGVLVPLISALMISSGSLCQSLVGGCILRKFCSPNYFNTVSDVFNFIFFGGILPCLIASTVGVSTLFFREVLNGSKCLNIGLPFGSEILSGFGFSLP